MARVHAEAVEDRGRDVGPAAAAHHLLVVRGQEHVRRVLVHSIVGRTLEDQEFLAVLFYHAAAVVDLAWAGKTSRPRTIAWSPVVRMAWNSFGNDGYAGRRYGRRIACQFRPTKEGLPR